MGVFEDIFVKAKVAVDALGEKAGQFVDVSKLNIKLAELKADLRAEFENLGKTMYHSDKNDTDASLEIRSGIAQIDNLSLQIEELKNQIASMKNKVLCKSCGSQNEEGSSYCTKCGGILTTGVSKPDENQEDDFTEFDD